MKLNQKLKSKNYIQLIFPGWPWLRKLRLRWCIRRQIKLFRKMERLMQKDFLQVVKPTDLPAWAVLFMFAYSLTCDVTNVKFKARSNNKFVITFTRQDPTIKYRAAKFLQSPNPPCS